MFLVKLSISSFNESSRVFSILNLESSIFTTSAVLLSAALTADIDNIAKKY
ncbi:MULTISPECIES: hypothetical protein [unclassified Methanobrevibacter]|jgi:hypothetical protein|uniref:hypothetical protein n=1 Tax=unclassified Methanobrevibacter TaxID=2638681 RepID=UPI0025D2F551|nr:MULTISPECIES: hypothetical protein [unclassified Methanobrevibacter]MEE0941705.1 hypothetical protein [Methanobrevibacter sp.]